MTSSSLANWAQSDFNTGYFNSLAISSSGDNGVAASFGGTPGSSSGIWYTTTSGIFQQSTKTSDGTIVNGAFYSVSLSSDGTKGIAGSGGVAGVWYTATSGATWTQSTNLQHANFESVALSSDGITGVAASSFAGVWYTTDSGANWTQSTNSAGGAISEDFNSLALTSVGKGIAGSSTGLWYTTDSGATWTVTRPTVGGFNSLALTSVGKGIAGSDNWSNKGVWYTTDSGATWTQSTNTAGGDLTGWFKSLQLSSTGTNGIAGSSTGLWYTTDSGATWTQSTNSAGGAVITDNIYSVSLSTDGTSGLAGSTTGLWYTTDSGSTWTQTTNADGGGVITSGFMVVALSSDGTNGVSSSDSMSNTGLWYTSASEPPAGILCVLTGTLILTAHGYTKVEDLRNGDLVKTYKNGYKKITNITISEISHSAEKEIIGEENKSLFILKRTYFPELIEDLILTGDHQLLVDDLETARKGGIDSFMKIDGKFGLRAYKEKKGKIYETPGIYKVYDIALEKRVYGIYANGLLVSSGVKHA